MRNPDPQTDTVAAAIAATHIPAYTWPQLSEDGRDRFRRMATAAIQAMGNATHLVEGDHG